MDLGFHQNVNKIMGFISKKLENAYLQKILVSAHFNEKVEGLIKDIAMDNPKYIGF